MYAELEFFINRYQIEFDSTCTKQHCCRNEVCIQLHNPGTRLKMKFYGWAFSSHKATDEAIKKAVEYLKEMDSLRQKDPGVFPIPEAPGPGVTTLD